MGDSQNRIALIALGSNLGNSAELIQSAFDRLEALSISPIRRSSLWRSEPVDCPPGSPPFINAAAALFPAPAETPESLLDHLLSLEKQFGRTPKRLLNEARTLDLDLIAFSNAQRHTPTLLLPHPRAHLRAFVLAPLAEVAPDFIFPGSNLSVVQLLSNAPDRDGVKRL